MGNKPIIMTTETKRCSACGKKVRLVYDPKRPGKKQFRLIADHDSLQLGSSLRYMSDPAQDETLEKARCPGSRKSPHRGRWYRRVGRVF
jgi:hypothetical protein